MVVNTMVMEVTKHQTLGRALAGLVDADGRQAYKHVLMDFKDTTKTHL
jgi:hypothetical protein